MATDLGTQKFSERAIASPLFTLMTRVIMWLGAGLAGLAVWIYGRKVFVNGAWAWPAQIAAVLYRRQRAAAYRDEMGAEQGDFVLTIDDVLDGILEQIAFMAANGVALTPEMQDMLTTRAAIKARIPKP